MLLDVLIQKLYCCFTTFCHGSCLDFKRSVRRTDLYPTTWNTHNRQTSMPTGGIRTCIPSKRKGLRAVHLTARPVISALFIYFPPPQIMKHQQYRVKNTLSVRYVAPPWDIYWRCSTIMGSLDIQFMTRTYLAFYEILYLISPIDGNSYFYTHL